MNRYLLDIEQASGRMRGTIASDGDGPRLSFSGYLDFLRCLEELQTRAGVIRQVADEPDARDRPAPRRP